MKLRPKMTRPAMQMSFNHQRIGASNIMPSARYETHARNVAMPIFVLCARENSAHTAKFKHMVYNVHYISSNLDLATVMQKFDKVLCDFYIQVTH